MWVAVVGEEHTGMHRRWTLWLLAGLAILLLVSLLAGRLKGLIEGVWDAGCPRRLLLDYHTALGAREFQARVKRERWQWLVSLVLVPTLAGVVFLLGQVLGWWVYAA
jgi:hypothetical protein